MVDEIQKIVIPNEVRAHNNLVNRVAQAGFLVPRPNKVTGFKLGILM